MFKRSSWIYLTFVMVSILCSNSTFAQSDSSARGTEFWITFPPNVHVLSDPFDAIQDSLFLFVVAADQSADVDIEYTDINGTVRTESFSVSPFGVGSFQVPWLSFELNGIQNSSVTDDLNLEVQLGQPAPQHFVVRSSTPVLVYGMTQAIYTSDAFLAIPKRHLGRHHMLLTYESDNTLRIDTTSAGIFDNRTPSQFAVLATEDSTEVTMQLTSNDVFFGVDSLVVTLNKGESYLVQADYSEGSDFTGSIVRSTKPIAVFTGHQRAYVPSSIVREIHALTENNEFLRNNLTRDALLEQTPSLKHLGNEYVIGTYIPPQDVQTYNPTRDTDKVRVVAVYDDTEVSVNGNVVARLDMQEFVELNLTQGLHITSSNPVHVGGIKKSSSHYINTTQTGFRDTIYGDPFLVYTAAVPQWDTAYTIYNVEALPQLDAPDSEAYPYQYVQLTGERDALLNLTIDGLQLSQLGSIIRTIDNSPYYFANVVVSSGVHQLQSTLPFGVTVYGFGLINSYGYIAGSTFRKISPEPEDIGFLQDTACFSITSSITGPATTLANIDSIELESGSQNVDLTFEIDSQQDTAIAELTLLDPYEDGFAYYKAVDTDGLSFRDTAIIPGFTLRLSVNPTPSFLDIDFTTAVDRTWCFEYVLENYGNINQDISDLQFTADNGFEISYPSVGSLAPGEAISVTICFTTVTPGDFNAELVVVGPCTMRELVAFAIRAGIDDQAPEFEILRDSCGVLSQVIVSENHDFASGLQTVNIEELQNINVTVVSENPDAMTFSVEVVDPYQDAWFTISAIDSAGLSQVYSDTIPGLTLSVDQFIDWQVDEYRPTPTKLFLCDTVVIENYGLYDYVIDASNFAGNTDFSAPPQQFPLLVPAGGQAELVVCLLHPRGLTSVSDMFIFTRGCTTRELIFTSALPTESLRGDTRCDVILTGEFVHGTDAVVISPVYPNPTSDVIAFDITSAQSSEAEIEVTDFQGRVVFRETIHVTRGTSTVATQLTGLIPGTYSLSVHKGQTHTRSSFVILP